MMLTGVTEGAEGDTEIAPPSSASILEPLRRSVCSADPPVMAGAASASVVSALLVHRRSNVSGLR